MKMVQITFALEGIHGNRTVSYPFFPAKPNCQTLVVSITCGRTFPQSIPAYMVCLESTLGAKLGTLFRAPRNSDRPAQDENAFTRSDYWNLLACKPQPPLNVSNSPGSSLLLLISFFWSDMVLLSCSQVITWPQSRQLSFPMNKGGPWQMLGLALVDWFGCRVSAAFSPIHLYVS